MDSFCFCTLVRDRDGQTNSMLDSASCWITSNRKNTNSSGSINCWFRMIKYFAGLLLGTIAVSLPVPASEVSIRANQIGYPQNASKVAIAFSSAAIPIPFEIRDLDTKKIVFEGRAKPLEGVSWGNVKHHQEI